MTSWGSDRRPRSGHRLSSTTSGRGQRARTGRPGRALASLILGLWVPSVPSLAYAEQSPAAQGSDETEAHPLDLDIERHVAEALAPGRRPDVPRFEVEVTGRWPSAPLEEHFRGGDLECGPTESGPPSPMEMRPYTGGSSIPVHADFLAPLKALVRLVKSRGPPRYFLYEIRYADRSAFALNDGPVSDAARYGTAEATWELVASFSDQGRGREALRRVERGGRRRAATAGGERLPPWINTTCRPPGFD